jgi:RNA polymerase sigma-70 factor, ECF subfamily
VGAIIAPFIPIEIKQRGISESTRIGGSTKLLLAWGDGDDRALEQLLPLVYRELHRAARRYMAGERPGHTLQAAALVDEAYLRLIDVRQIQWQNRAQFFGLSAQLMRRILMDFARRRHYLKRAEGRSRSRSMRDSQFRRIRPAN